MERSEIMSYLGERARMGGWLLMAIAGFLFIYRAAPHMAEVELYKLALAPAAAYAFYQLDCSIGEAIRPHELLAQAKLVRAQAMTLADSREREESMRRADRLEDRADRRYMRLTILISAGLIAIAVAS